MTDDKARHLDADSIDTGATAGCDEVAIDRVIADNKASDATVSPQWDQVKAILVEHLGCDPAKVTPTILIPQHETEENLDADSLDVVELIMAFEEDFGIEITDAEAEKVTTVAEAVFLIDDKLRDR